MSMVDRNLDKFEERTRVYFEEKGIYLKRIGCDSKKTPDFENSYCLVETKHYDGKEKISDTIEFDPTFNAILGHCEKAAKQFEAYDPSHKKIHLLTLFSSELEKEDILSVFSGCLIPGIQNISWKKLEPRLSLRYSEQIDAILLFRTIDSSKPIIYSKDRGHKFVQEHLHILSS